ncbi:hypothetical protein Q9L42_008975 [Methylomarinum sp. Ch1-1]|uniref:Uncharacterized protein n=1 Tax=Methylomarinum roseum TaxID=3067653 RepID=A0AAU7NZ36_9GAMM|nr:hypothetical protein [Methylomarinum sp. Ch1-1]MDP4521636.1 hypothetical protein [Methylomarinum sp. Ch1-1]
MKNLKKDIINGLLFVVGIFGFISGAFIISTVSFGAAAIFSNIDFNNRLHA